MFSEIESDDIETLIQKVRAREESFKHLEMLSNLGSWEVSLRDSETIWSDQSYIMYGLKKETTTPSLELFFSLLLPEYVQKAKKLLNEAIISGEVVSFECKAKKADGVIIDLLLNGKVIYDKDNAPLKIIGSTQDVTQRVALQRHSEQLFKLIEFSSKEVYVIDKESYRYLYVNKGSCDALGYSSQELLKMSIFDINPYLTQEMTEELKTEYERVSSGILNRTIHKRKNGELYHVQSYLHSMEYNGVGAFVIFDTDITDIVELEDKLYHQANHDMLTSLPNRTLFKDRLLQSIKRASRNNENFAMFYLDLDQFKIINDSLGHHIGDEVLIITANRLRNTLRDEDTLARLGGDEFTVILKNITTLDDIILVAQKIIDAMKEPIEIENHTLYISSSIGISLYPKDATNEHDLIKYADTAMYKAKDLGRDNFQFYSSKMTELAYKRIEMASALRVAIKEKQFLIYFQPQFNSLDGAIVGMEALVRWQHPKHGFLVPNQFIPIAKETGLILEIDQIVMSVAMKQFKKWHDDGLNPGILALNLTMKQLDKDDFVQNLVNTMETLSFKSNWLELEVTEGEVMNNAKASIEKLNQISSIGVELAIDDFGTGYSSLAYLKKLPLERLKIDHSFIREVPKNEEDSAIIKAIIALGKSLNLQLTAEGVETKAQKEFLALNGCFTIQGYYYAKPMCIDDVTKLLKKKKTSFS